jgi:predicted naringenin-chalcone synthase
MLQSGSGRHRADPEAFERTAILNGLELLMPMLIAGIGTALPPHRIAQADAAEIAQHYSCKTAAQERLFKGMYRRAGVETRHSVVLESSDGELVARQSFYSGANPTTGDRMRKYEEHAGALAVAAARESLDDAGMLPERVTHLVTVSCSGFCAPGFDIALFKQLGLPGDVARTHVGFMGCHGLLNGMRVAQAFLAADPRACVLLCAVEMCSLHHQYGWNSDQIVANALFADGAAALVAVSGQSSSSKCYQLVASGSRLLDDCEDAMTWRIADHGFLMTLSPRVPELISRTIRPFLESWLATQGTSLAAVGSWAVHPGGPRILAAVGEATGLDRTMLEHSYQVLAEYGNMSSPTVLFILDRLRRAQAPRPCVALAFGPGLAVESALLI